MRHNSKPSQFLPHFATVLTLAVVAVAFWQWRILAPAARDGPIGSLCSDLYTQYLPVLARAAQEIGNGRLPLWNPDQLAGVPAVATWHQFGALYPLNALFLFLPAHVALGWTACLHLIVAGAGMYWLAHALDLSSAAARLAAVISLLSQPLAVQPNLFAATTLAPAVLASWVMLAKQPRPAAVALAAALTALQFSTGGTQIVVYTIYAVALLLPCTLLAQMHSSSSKTNDLGAGLPRRTGWPAWRPGRAAGSDLWPSIAAAAAAALLALGLAAALLLPATAALELSSRATGRLSLADTVPFPTPTLLQLARQLLDPTPGVPRVFFGWAALILALLGLARPARRSVALGLLLIVAMGVVLVLGPNTPAYSFYYRLPTGGWFRSPERAALLIGVGVALLAALGVEHLYRRGWHRCASLLVLLPAIELFRATSSWLPYPQVRSAAEMARPATLPSIRSTIGSGRAYIALNWQDRFPFMEKLGTWGALPVAQDYDSLTPAVYGDYFRALLGAEALVDPIFAGRYHAAFGSFTARRALDLLAVNLIVIAPGAEVQWLGTRSTAPAGSAPRLLKNRWALPRAYIVHRVVTVADDQQALELLKDPAFEPTSTAVVVGGEAIDVPPRDDSGASRVEITTPSTDEVILHARLDRPGLLVLNDLVFPGWEARVDSQPAPIVRTNGLFRGVYLDSGEHVVEFAYRAPGLVLGSWLTGVSLVVLVIMVVPRRRQRGAVWRPSIDQSHDPSA